jgi:transposase
MIKEPAKLQPYNTKDLCHLYGVSYKTIQKWLKKIEDQLGERIGKMWNINQVEIIFKRYGRPEAGSVGK